MNNEVIDEIKLAAYFLWEYTEYQNALNHWYCSEDTACFLERFNILDKDKIAEIVRLGVNDLGYIGFVRDIAFRIYIYTNNSDADSNWFIAERLIRNAEWCVAITKVARFYRNTKNTGDFTSLLKSDVVRKHYRAPYL